MIALNADTDENISFDNVYLGLKLIDNTGDEITVYVINKPLDEGNQIDGKMSGVVLEYDSYGESTNRIFYSYGTAQINTPRMTGLFNLIIPINKLPVVTKKSIVSC